MQKLALLFISLIIVYYYRYRRPMRHNYLNNKDLLAEIHKSKTTYCTFKKPEDADYDIILKKPSQINPSNIRKAKKNRIEKLMKKQYEATKDKSKVQQIRPREIRDQDLVFRVMTWEHIPEDIDKNEEIPEETDENAEIDPKILKKLKIPLKKKYVKVNFPPFQHFKVDKNGKARCVGKSHWTGSLKDGHFSKDHGQMTDKLAHMFLKLCERYGTRGNWRGYTYNDEMRNQALLQLVQIGLQFDESKSANPFAYYTAVISNSFTRVLNIEKKNQNIRDDILELNNLSPSYTRQNSWGGGGGGDYDHE